MAKATDSREYATHIGAVEHRALLRRDDIAAWQAAWRARDRWDERWQRAFTGYFKTQLDDRIDLDKIVATAVEQSAVYKATPPPAAGPPTASAVAGAIATQVAVDQFAVGAQAVYVGLALDTAQDAGQFSLDALGLNRTFRWASQRDMARDVFAVHGSKIIQHAYGNHVAKLAGMVANATIPEKPKTIDQLTKEIRQQWAELTRQQARRIARTEAANIWERTNWYAMRANGIQRVIWSIASGPAIGVRVGPVCDICLAKHEEGPYVMDDLLEGPPAHPNCRCTLIPVLDPTWLPPAEPWTGNQAPLPLEGLAEGQLPQGTPIQKARHTWTLPKDGVKVGWHDAWGGEK